MGSRVRCFVRLHGIISNRRATRSPLRRVVIISCTTSKLLGIIIQPPCPPKPSVVLSNLTVFLLERRLLTRGAFVLGLALRAAHCFCFLTLYCCCCIALTSHITPHTTHRTQEATTPHISHITNDTAPHPTIWGAGAAG